MKHSIFCILFTYLLSVTSFAQIDLIEEAILEAEAGSNGQVAFRWDAPAGATYFWQTSVTLDGGWVYMPQVIAGDNTTKERFVLAENTDKLFARIISTNQTASDVEAADFDGDGFANIDEVRSLGTDPLKRDTDEDGIADGQEDSDRDGLADGWEKLIIDADLNDSWTDINQITVANVQLAAQQVGVNQEAPPVHLVITEERRFSEVYWDEPTSKISLLAKYPGSFYYDIPAPINDSSNTDRLTNGSGYAYAFSGMHDLTSIQNDIGWKEWDGTSGMTLGAEEVPLVTSYQFRIRLNQPAPVGGLQYTRKYLQVIDDPDISSDNPELEIITLDFSVEAGETISGLAKINGDASKTVVSPPSNLFPNNVVELLHVNFNMDLNNDLITNQFDAVLRETALKLEATDEQKEKATEYIALNDNLSNGWWDLEDPTTKWKLSDDDSQKIVIDLGLQECEVWLEHPAINGFVFYSLPSCEAASKVDISFANKFSHSPATPLPSHLFLRVEGAGLTFPSNNPQISGDLVLKIKMGGSQSTEKEISRIKLTVVKDLGAEKYFHMARDYIYEQNARSYTHDKKYGENVHYRLVIMREEGSDLFAYDSYNHTANKPRVKGINQVALLWGSADVIINGNQSFFSSGIPFPNKMTDRCDGRFCKGLTIKRPPSDDTHHALGGSTYGRWVGYKLGEPELVNGEIVQENDFFFKAGQIPEGQPSTPHHGLGGLSTNYGLPVRQTTENQIIGYAPVGDKGMVFTATNFPGKGGKAIEFAADAKFSGVPPLPDGNPDDLKLFFLDGSDSVGLCVKNGNGKLNLVIEGDKHTETLSTYYINTYLLFQSRKPH